MSHCDDIAPLLSAYSDGELSPLETDQVTRHLDSCEACRDTLVDFVLLGHHLRSAVPMPSLDGFVENVMGSIAAERRPLRDRALNWLDELRGRWVAIVSLGGAAIATAALLLVLAEPATVGRLASLFHGPANPVVEVAKQEPPRNPVEPEPVAVTASVPSNSQAFISRLEAKPPSVATWSEPDNKTTVIWLGDDASGND
ncbi:MAG TPA: zf-HC2 domain-containing protein [Candidatus Binataceae bacterium]|nr:zf-HC2 domain-containing protein [Candidatus Binataceae bacterium]